MVDELAECAVLSVCFRRPRSFPDPLDSDSGSEDTLDFSPELELDDSGSGTALDSGLEDALESGSEDSLGLDSEDTETLSGTLAEAALSEDALDSEPSASACASGSSSATELSETASSSSSSSSVRSSSGFQCQCLSYIVGLTLKSRGSGGGLMGNSIFIE
jgi:hypothetical protein